MFNIPLHVFTAAVVVVRSIDYEIPANRIFGGKLSGSLGSRFRFAVVTAAVQVDSGFIRVRSGRRSASTTGTHDCSWQQKNTTHNQEAT